MAATVTLVKRAKFMGENGVVVTVKGDNAYPTGGYLVDLTKLGLSLPPSYVAAEPASGYVPEYDYTNKKLIVRWAAAAGSPLAEVTNGTNLSAVTFRLFAIGE